jgi:hypothetical protein
MGCAVEAACETVATVATMDGSESNHRTEIQVFFGPLCGTTEAVPFDKTWRPMDNPIGFVCGGE